MKYTYYNPVDESGGCIYRAISKLLNKDYNLVKEDIRKIANTLNKKENDIETFEYYLKENNVTKINDYNNIQIKDLNLRGEYIILCYDKKDFYHMVTIIDNTIYDKDNNSLNLYVISTYKK